MVKNIPKLVFRILDIGLGIICDSGNSVYGDAVIQIGNKSYYEYAGIFGIS